MIIIIQSIWGLIFAFIYRLHGDPFPFPARIQVKTFTGLCVNIAPPGSALYSYSAHTILSMAL